MTPGEDVHVRELPPLMSIPEAAAECRVARSTFYALMRQGLVDTVKVGGRRLVRGQDLARYIERLAGPSMGRRRSKGDRR